VAASGVFFLTSSPLGSPAEPTYPRTALNTSRGLRWTVSNCSEDSGEFGPMPKMMPDRRGKIRLFDLCNDAR